jgi:hypothetical protein
VREANTHKQTHTAVVFTCHLHGGRCTQCLVSSSLNTSNACSSGRNAAIDTSNVSSKMLPKADALSGENPASTAGVGGERVGGEEMGRRDAARCGHRSFAAR